ncbi:hypothetical protein Godav_027600 [Gossypium davidsonii]|uniref:RNase H type-1 domain-containing protein n=2 Tax=Gossypium TaxID=3633 RepID=A0A7J8RWK3_GOSDV|nr:hypothetical protein [Gossypium davidsonii]MBA0653571.1 hypothetical protein [Gossypium klotzschianum]
MLHETVLLLLWDGAVWTSPGRIPILILGLSSVGICLYHEDIASTPPELASFICSNFYSLPLLVVHVLVPKGFRSTRSRPVAAPMIKENINATFRGKTSSSCSGVVIRDCQGLVFGACTRRHQYVSSPFAAETLAFLTMAIFACDLDLSWIMFEGDSLHVIRRLTSS